MARIIRRRPDDDVAEDYVVIPDPEAPGVMAAPAAPAAPAAHLAGIPAPPIPDAPDMGIAGRITRRMSEALGLRGTVDLGRGYVPSQSVPTGPQQLPGLVEREDNIQAAHSQLTFGPNVAELVAQEVDFYICYYMSH